MITTIRLDLAHANEQAHLDTRPIFPAPPVFRLLATDSKGRLVAAYADRCHIGPFQC